MNKKLIIFDFDDTLTDNSKRDLMSFEHIIKKFNLLSIDHNEFIKLRKNSFTSEYIIKKLMDSDDDKLYKKYSEERLIFLEKNLSYKKYVKLKPNTLEILEKLKSDNYLLALNSIKSNHNNFLNIIKSFKLENYFEEIATQKLIPSNESYESRFNTKIILYNKILNKLKFKNQKGILVIGNLFSDILSAKSLNMKYVMIKGSFNFDNSQNYECNKITELQEIYKFI